MERGDHIEAFAEDRAVKLARYRAELDSPCAAAAATRRPYNLNEPCELDFGRNAPCADDHISCADRAWAEDALTIPEQTNSLNLATQLTDGVRGTAGGEPGRRRDGQRLTDRMPGSG